MAAAATAGASAPRANEPSPRPKKAAQQSKFLSNPSAEVATPQNVGEHASSSLNPPTVTLHPSQASREVSAESMTPQISGNGMSFLHPPTIVLHPVQQSQEASVDAVTAQEGMPGQDLPTTTSHLQQVSVQAIAPQVVAELVAAFRKDLSHLVEELRNQGAFENEVRDKIRTVPASVTFSPQFSPELPSSARVVGSQSHPATYMSGMAAAGDVRPPAFANGNPDRGAAGAGAAPADETTVATQLVAPMMNAQPMRMEIGMSTPLVDPVWSWGPGGGEGYHLTPQVDVMDEPANRPASFQEDMMADAGVMTFSEKLKVAQESMHAGKPAQSWLVKNVTSFLEDPESSLAASYYSQCMTAFSFFAILVGMSPYVGVEIPLYVEVVVDSILCLEIAIRGIFCPDFKEFLSNYANLIDSLSAAPLTVIFLIQFGLYDRELGSAFLLAAVPVIRLLRFSRRFTKMQILITAFKDCLEALPVLLYTLAVMGCVFTSAMFLVEPRDNIATLPESAWLVIATISTVGYGDVTPCTKFGAAIASVLMVVSQLYMAMPFGIIGYNFTVIWERRAQIMLLNGTRDRLAKLGFGAYEIPRLFDLFDLDDSAEFDMEEFQLFFRELEIGFNEHDVAELFKLIDKDCSGTVDEREFVKAVYPNEYRNMYRDRRRTVKKDGEAEPPTEGAGTPDVREVFPEQSMQ